jgi:cardiolipin synthase
VIRLRDIPNMLTIMRLLLVFPLVFLLLQEYYGIALLIFFIAGISDGLDGYLAKKYQWTSVFGAVADPIADKLLMVTSYFVMCWQLHLPWWLFVIILIRDLVIVSGGLFYNHLFGLNEVVPTYLSKTNTFLQILLVLVVMFGLAFQLDILEFKDWLIYLVTFTTVGSGIQYSTIWGVKAVRNVRQQAKDKDKEKDKA